MNDGLSDRTKEEIQRVLEAHPRVTRAVLFGSRAMGNFRPSSDIDLALEGKGLNLSDLLSLKAALAEYAYLSVEVDLLIRDRIQNPALEEHIKEKGVLWWERIPEPNTSV